MVNHKSIIKYISLFFVALIFIAAGFSCQTPAAPAETPSAPPASSTPAPSTPAPTPTPSPAPAPVVTPSAKITGVTGEVMVKRASADVWIKAEVGMNLEAGDSIKTSENSTATILFFEGSTTELSKNTEIRISELSVKQGTMSTTIKIRQEIGKTKNRVEKLIDPASQYEIETPTGAAIARGSANEVVVYSNGTTTILNIEGNWYALVNGQLIPIPQSMVIWLFQGGSFSVSDPGSGIGGTAGGSGGDSGGSEQYPDGGDGPPIG